MAPDFENSIQVLEYAQKEVSYDKLVIQLKKDFELANIDLRLPKNPSPNQIKTELHEKIYRLILEEFPEYLNLLYVVDVSEDKIKDVTATDVVDMADAVCFLILKRERQKVWFKQKFRE